MTIDDFESHINNSIEVSSITGTIAVALSGGSDSLALTIALSKMGHNPLAILVNHHLRKTADYEIKITTKTLQKLNIKYAVQNWDGDYKHNLEAEARKARYKLLLDICKQHNINNLCIGHHIDDQIETFLLNLARGSGLDGLCAMPKKLIMQDINIIRPMLNLTKKNCQEYLQALDIKWCEDESNKDTKYKRNKIRFLLENIENKDLLIKRINNTINTLQEVREILTDIIRDTEDKITQFTTNSCEINKPQFLELKPYLQKSILVNVIMRLSMNNYKPRLYQMDNIIHNIKHNHNAKCTIRNLIIKCIKDKIIVHNNDNNS